MRTYDGFDRVTEEQTPQGEVTYAYDASGRRTSMTVAGQSAVNYTWDNANRLTGITQGTSSVGLAYDNANRRTTLTLPNGVTVSYTYDLDSHITGLTYMNGLNPVREFNGGNPPSPTAELLTRLNIVEYFTRTNTTGAMNFLTDALGWAVALTDSGGSINTSYTYEPLEKTTCHPD